MNPRLMDLRALILVQLLIGVAACKRFSPDSAGGASDAAGAVTWSVDSPGERLQRGVVRTEPKGFEQSLVPGLAGGSQRWAAACGAALDRALSQQATVTATLTLQIDHEGFVRTVRGDGTPLGACLAEKAPGEGVRKAREDGSREFIQATVIIDFSSASR